MYTMVDEIDRFHPDLIIGPVYGSVYKALMDDLTNKNIPVIYPLSSRSEEFGVYPDFIQVKPFYESTDCCDEWLVSAKKRKKRIWFVRIWQGTRSVIQTWKIFACLRSICIGSAVWIFMIGILRQFRWWIAFAIVARPGKYNHSAYYERSWSQ